MIKKTQHGTMLRFLFCVSLVLSSTSAFSAEENYTFSEKQIYPVLRRGTDLHSGITFLAGALASAATRSYDDEVRAKWKDNQKIGENESHAGDILGSGAATVVVAGAQYFFDPNESRYQSQLRGLAYGGISIYVLKTAFGRNRPGTSHSHQSFPSGHTAITFMTATQLAYAYGWPTGAVAFPLAIFTAATRLSDDAHWFSDTVGGAFLGYLVGRATFYDSSEYGDYAGTKKEGNQTSYQLIPLVNSKYSGVSFLLSF